MQVKKIVEQAILDTLTPEQEKAVLDSIAATVKEAKAVRERVVESSADIVFAGLKQIEAKLVAKIDQEAAKIKQPRDGIDGIQGPKGEKGDKGADGAQGRDGRAGKDGKDGRDGVDGVSVVDARVDFDGSLTIVLSDGTEINAGEVMSSEEAKLIHQVTSHPAGTGSTSQEVLDALAAIQATIATYGTMAKQNANAVAITGGNIDGTTIGGTTPAAGTFTTLTATTANIQNAGANSGLTMLRNTDAGTASTRIFLDSSGGVASIYNSGNNVRFQTGASIGTSSGSTQFLVSPTASAVNYVQVTGAATGSGPTISAQGSDSAMPMQYAAKGGSTHQFYGSVGGSLQFQISNVSSSVNRFTVNGSTTGNAIPMSASGTDTNISMAFLSKGTGAIDLAAGSSGVNISNGGTVTAITRTGAGSGYTSPPTVAITAPTTAGGVQATATVNLEQTSSTGIIASGGTGYTVNDVITVSGGTQTTPSTYTVTSVSAGVITGLSLTQYGSYSAVPSNPVSVTGGTGTGATLNITWQIKSSFTITNAGSGYVEQPTVSFSGGGGSGAAAYATVGSNTVQKTIGNIHTFATPNSQVLALVDKNSAGNYPTNSSVAFAMVPPQSAFGAAYFGVSNPLYLASSSTAASAFAFATGVTTPVSNGAGGATQMQVAHTASAVNYVQVTGAATGSEPQISAQGSDANVTLQLAAKGVQPVKFLTGGSIRQAQVSHTASAVNFLQLTGGIATAAPVLSAQGTDTNIDLALTPKGTGSVKIGAAPLATTNFSIVESGGKLLFKYGATTIASMDSTGIITSLSNIVANGTP